MFSARSLAYAGLMPPALAGWLPDALLLVAGVVAVTRRGPAGSGAEALRSHAAAVLARTSDTLRGWQGSRAGRFAVRRRILDWYYLRIYGAIYLVTLGGLLGLYYLSMLTDLSQDLLSGGATLAMMARFLWFSTPQTLSLVIPISALIATLVTIGLLSRRTELVIARACGISVYRTALPFVAASLLWSGALFGLEEYVVPPSDRQAMMLWSQMHGRRAADGAAERHWVASRSGAIYHYGRFDPAKDEILDLTVFELDARNRLRRRTFVARAVYAGRADGDMASWAALDGRTWEFGPDGKVRATRPFADDRLLLEAPSYFRLDRTDARQMTYAELRRYVTDLRARGVDATANLVALQRKLSFPFIAVILTLLAIPFGTTAGGRGALYGIGLGICLAFGCWISFNVFGGLGKAEVLDPWMAAWAPTTLWGGFAMYLLLTVRT
jgi:lipopolysaccharide export system permease protein